MMDWGSGFQLLFADGLWLDEGVEELRQEKKVTSPLSTQEEIEKLTIDENLSPVQRALILIKGQPLQQICVLNELPNKIKSNNDFLYKVVPEVCTVLKTAPLEVQRHAAICFSSIIRSHVLQPHVSATVFLPTVLIQLRSLHPDIGQCWLDTAKVCIDHLPKDVVRKEFVPLVCEMGRLSQTVAYRVTACELCGVLVTKFEPYWINKELWPLVRSLCQDVDLSVRSTMTQNLSKVAAGLGKDLSKCVLTEITLLIEDEELSVKVVAVEALVDIVPHVNEVSCKEILSLFIKVCKAAMVKKDKLLVAVSGGFGRAVHNLEDYMEEDETSWFLEFYKDLCRFESVSRNESNSTVSVVMNLEDCDVECRRWAAFNAPGLVLFCGSRNYLGSLHHCIVRLSQDPSFVVRRQLAFGFHEIMKYLKISSNTVLKVLPVYQHLLRDNHEEVIEGVLQHLDEVLTMLSDVSGLSIQPAMPDFIGSLLSCERQLQSKLQWRLQESFISKISFVEGLVSPEQLYLKFVPVTFKYILGNVVYPVRLAASKTLLHYLRHMRRADYRDEICARITSDCLGCSSYKGRLMFLDIIEMIMELFSWSFFKQTFFKSVLLLSSDKIVNVRMRFYRMLPSLKRCLKLPSDRLLLKELEGCVRMAISSEMDTEASNCLRESVAELDQVNITLEVYSRQTYFEDEIIDQQKEEEEKQLWVEDKGVVSKQHANDSIKRSMSSDDRLKSASFTRVYSEKGGKASQNKVSVKKPLYSPQISKKTSNHGSSGSGSSTPPNALKLPGTSKSNSVSQLVKKSTCPGGGNTPGSLPSSGEGSCNSTPGSSPTTDRTNSLQNLTTSQKVQKTKNSSPLISRRNTSPHILKSAKTTTKVQKAPSKEIVSPSGSTAKRKISQKSKKL